jgi:hypothetical protein
MTEEQYYTWQSRMDKLQTKKQCDDIVKDIRRAHGKHPAVGDLISQVFTLQAMMSS